MNTLETTQNYLEAIYIISLKNPHVRAVDVCEYLGFSRPTVSIALKKLDEEGYLKYQDNLIHLTTKGKKEAQRMYERHELLAKMFMIIGVDEKIAYEDACKIEHDLSDETFKAIKNHYLKMEEK